MNRNLIRGFVCLSLLGGLLQVTGCSRSVINYQIAESIGTVGMYDNNEPVESPQMKMEREQAESEAAIEAAMVETLDQADTLAKGYQYEEAIAFLQNADIDQEDERVQTAIAGYQTKMEQLYEYEGNIPHLSFPNLIVDTELAFDGDGNASTYDGVMITLSEFEKILQELYNSGYFLIDIHSLAEETVNESGQTVLTSRNPVIPEGKKPMVLSIDNLNYGQIKNGDGIATRLTLDQNGEVKAVYTDNGGHDVTGDYDVVPVLEAFIAEHPDFSFQGARGIIGLSGKYGAFGYQVEEDDDVADYSDNRKQVKAIAAALVEDGWTLACESYSYDKLNEYSFDSLKEDITHWENTIGELTGPVDTLIFPYGSEVDYASEKLSWLTGEGFEYFIGLWPSDDYREVQDEYMRQTRRMVNGYMLKNSPNLFSTFFSVSGILDEERP